MHKETTLANQLTISRLYAIIPISAAVVAQWQLTAGILYLLAIATDALDGYFARKQQTASQYGSDLDGVVDFWFSAATLWWLWKIQPHFYTQHATPVLLGIAAFASFMLISQVKKGSIVMMHLYSAKLSTTLFAAWIPLALFATLPGWYVWLTILAVIISRAENTAYILRS